MEQGHERGHARVAGEHMLGEAVLAAPRPIHVRDDLSFGDLGDRDVEAGDPLGRAATSRTVKLIPVTPGPSRSKSRGATVSVPRGSIISTTVSSPTRKWSEVEPATVAGSAVQRSHDRSLEDDAFRNDVARPCAVDPMTARCRFAVAGTPTGYAAAPSGTFAADGHGAPSARSRSPMSATSTASRPRRLAVARARADASLGPADVRGLGSNVMLRPG